MRVTGALLYHYLSESMSVARLGRNLSAREFSLPEFYLRGTEPENGRCYIARSGDLPMKCGTECLFLCIGSRPAQVWSSWRCMVLYIDEPDADLLTLANHVLRFCDQVDAWESRMQTLLAENAPLEELARSSVPLFENCITITDYNYNILVNFDTVGEGEDRKICIMNDMNRIPDNVVISFSQTARQMSLRREPFSMKGQRENPDGDNYCINLYLGNTYYGTCTLWNKIRPMNERDKILFVRFAGFIRQALSAHPATPGNQTVTLKSIFSDLLRSFPVSRQDLDWAVQLAENNLQLHDERMGQWHIVVIKRANRNQNLPVEYICASLEDMLPNCTAVVWEERLVGLTLVPEGEICENTICDILAPYLTDMNFCAGVSAPFDDLMYARRWYTQAAAILDTGRRYAPEQRLYRFSDYILPYMLRQSRGELEQPQLLTPGLRKLRELDGSVDYWGTLRLYLENECNASKTAQDLYLHRSSLLPRLEKLRTLVDMDTPEQRLYLRMCMTLLDMEDARKEQKK